ncbi:MAG: peptidylprolyl isomerase [Pseudomonadota bacterium]|nr:peptidylprolyl isomerase [Pseudomonadota bacterium]
MNFARRLALAAFAAAACLPLATLAQTQPSSCQPKGNTPMKVKLTTSMGPIVIELDKAKAPVSVDNFVKYVESGHYNGTIFHRVIDGFMIQGGGFGNDMRQKPTQPPIKNEGGNGLKNDAYTLAMARTSIPDSATSQFFINVSDNASLNASGGNAGYAVFGKVVEGKDTVDKIRKVATGNKGGHQNVPTEAVVIEKAECV